MIPITPKVWTPGRVDAAPLYSPRSSVVFAYDQPLRAETVAVALEFHHHVAYRCESAHVRPADPEIVAPLDAGLSSPADERSRIDNSQAKRPSVAKGGFFMQEL